ncbi:hypothetical protein O181_074796 [Austropuccinia psidii MF-1]|uniref:Uncharacterized protein n=1 Tax=Austropuccinia psidii MF-1 TaxID=1389203 RepID=A0A9Q3F790_9BASI|nr:hypothetical protein [Austropuccinia psidii MF-1]
MVLANQTRKIEAMLPAVAETLFKQGRKSKEKPLEKVFSREGGNHAFDTFRFTKTRISGEVQELRTKEGTLTQDKEDQAHLLFEMLSKEGDKINLSGITLEQKQEQWNFSQITINEIQTNICLLPVTKEVGLDKITNELIKISGNLFTNRLMILFNLCLKLG